MPAFKVRQVPIDTHPDNTVFCPGGLQVTNFADAIRIAFAAGMGSEKEWRHKYLVDSPRSPE